MHSLCQKLLMDRLFSSNRERRQRPVLLDQLSQHFYVARAQRWGELVDGMGFGDTPSRRRCPPFELGARSEDDVCDRRFAARRTLLIKTAHLADGRFSYLANHLIDLATPKNEIMSVYTH